MSGAILANTTDSAASYAATESVLNIDNSVSLAHPQLRDGVSTPSNGLKWTFFGAKANVTSTLEKIARVTESALLLSATLLHLCNPAAQGPLVAKRVPNNPLSNGAKLIGKIRDGLFSFDIVNTAYRVCSEGLKVLHPWGKVSHSLNLPTKVLEGIHFTTATAIDTLTPVLLGASLLGLAAATPIGTALGAIWMVNTSTNVIRTARQLYYAQDIQLKNGAEVYQFKDASGKLLKDELKKKLALAGLDLVMSFYCAGILTKLPMSSVIKPASMAITGGIGLLTTFSS